ncbi:MAG: hypothetical protein DI563_06290 [Variovorax paradoxus]|uniref:Uncharacterized protein n=1 Tax=Variovorax paradoxus TaxID=34073 RepID=A0A2W5QI69_VARPD|nr:MAG: hypothetical protein DI563_06290 [Variovorax paradoxus]
MTRLAPEFDRLYAAVPNGGTSDGALIGPGGEVRALVMELTAPPAWDSLGQVWRGVQVDLGFPAPAIAVSGIDGLQLWFSLAQAVSAPDGHAFLHALSRRFLPDVPVRRLRLFPNPVSGHARPVPECRTASGDWSAFVAPDLAPVFGDTPWLDIPPSDEGQAALLAGLTSIPRAAFDAAVALLGDEGSVPAVATIADPAEHDAAAAAALRVDPTDDPLLFLQQVMSNERVPLALRVEAAKALLAHRGGGGR